MPLTVLGIFSALHKRGLKEENRGGPSFDRPLRSTVSILMSPPLLQICKSRVKKLKQEREGKPQSLSYVSPTFVSQDLAPPGLRVDTAPLQDARFGKWRAGWISVPTCPISWLLLCSEQPTYPYMANEKLFILPTSDQMP